MIKCPSIENRIESKSFFPFSITGVSSPTLIFSFQEYSVQITFRQQWNDDRLSYESRLTHGDMRGTLKNEIGDEIENVVILQPIHWTNERNTIRETVHVRTSKVRLFGKWPPISHLLTNDVRLQNAKWTLKQNYIISDS